MRIFCIFFILSFISNAQVTNKKLTKEEFEKQRWNRIKGLIDQEIKVINRVKRKSQKLQYRLFELKSERIKLFKEKENKKFLQLKQKYGSKIKRKNVFKKTLKLFKEANNYGRLLLRKYPKTRYKAAIYYTLALNSRDFSYNNNELKYLKLAIKYSKYDKNIRYLATTSIAEYYYNNKKYSKAIVNYEKIINNKEDEWLTKNLYNYGWCLLKTKKFNESINRLEESFNLSSDEFYVDVREQVMTSLVSFYVYGQEIQRGINFIKKNASGKNASLLKLAQKSSGKGFYKETEQIIQMLEDAIDKKMEFELYADLKLFKFDVYKQYHKPKKLLKVANSFPTLKFSEYQSEEAIRKISDVVGSKQLILKKDFSKYNKEYNKTILKEIINYFNILAIIHPEEKPLYEYYKAETYYSVQRFKSALDSYKVSLIDYDKKASKEDLRLKNVDAIFSCIELIDFKKSEKVNELEFAYNKYLSYWPKSKKANLIYPRLFSLYMDKKDYDNSQRTIDRYISSFPKKRIKQKELFKVQLDRFIKEKNTNLLSQKINKIRGGYLDFPQAEIKKSETILANILFDNLRKINSKGDSKGALLGYQKIHFTDSYPASVKAEAAFNMAMIYTDLSDNNNAIKWYKKSFTFFTDKEKNDKRVFLEKMALRTQLLQNFRDSAHLNNFILDNFCSQKKKNIKIFQNSVKNELANDYITKAFFTIDKRVKCISKFPTKLKEEVMDHLFIYNHETKLSTFIDDFNLKLFFKDKVAFYYERLFWKYYTKDNSKEQFYFRRLKRIKTKKTKTFTSAYQLLFKFRKLSNNYLKRKITPSTPPNPGQFSTKLQNRLAQLGPIIKKADEIFKVGHGQISILTYDQLIVMTNSLSNEIKNYSIPIPDKDFQKQFKNQMNILSDNINNQSKKYLSDSQELVDKYQLLVNFRDNSHPGYNILRISDIVPNPSNKSFTMDTGIK